MKIFNGKKGLTWQQLALAIIALMVVVMVIWWFQKAGSKGIGGIGEKIDDLGDCDNDQVANMFDKCPCDPVGNNPLLDGCPDNVKDDKDTRYGKTDCCPKKS